jgi:hypothetical protein
MLEVSRWKHNTMPFLYKRDTTKPNVSTISNLSTMKEINIKELWNTSKSMGIG